MKTFKQYCEQFKDLPINKMSDKVDKLHTQFDKELYSGDISKAYKTLDRVGKIKDAIMSHKIDSLKGLDTELK